MTLVPQERGAVAAAPIVAAVLAVCAVLGTTWLRLGLPTVPCLFQVSTGLPCLTCGTTRLCEALLAGDVLSAASWNPLVFVGLSVTTLWALVSTGRWLLGFGSWSVVLDGRERVAVRLALVPLVAANWTYLIWHGV